MIVMLSQGTPFPSGDCDPANHKIDAMFDMTEKPLRFLQIGDLHITDAGLPNHLDLRRIVEEVNGKTAGNIDLPGDNADDGTPEQFRIVHDELSRLGMRFRVTTTSNHDRSMQRWGVAGAAPVRNPTRAEQEWPEMVSRELTPIYWQGIA